MPSIRKRVKNPNTCFLFVFSFRLPSSGAEAKKGLFKGKGKVSRDFEWLQIILMNRAWAPDVPLKVLFFYIYIFILL